MPAQSRSIELQERFSAQLIALWQRVVRLMRERYATVDPDDLRTSFRAFVPAATELLELGKSNAAGLSDAFLALYVQSELGERPDLGAASVDHATTSDGRPLANVFAAVPAKVFLSIKNGRDVQQALAYGRFAVTRIAQTEVLDAAREQIGAHLNEGKLFSGWRWRSVGQTCLACLAADNGKVRPSSATLRGHPFCDCVQEPVVSGAPDTVQRPLGRDKFDALSPAEQDARYGRKASLIREGELEFNAQDLIKVQRSKEWREVVTDSPIGRAS